MIRSTTVTTVANGNEITVANMEAFAPGDDVIVESLHGYNEDGLDGNWGWVRNGNYYFDSGIKNGKSWQGKIDRISGNTIYLSRPVSPKAVGLRLLRDDADLIASNLADGSPWPEQEHFYCWGQVRRNASEKIIDLNGCTIEAPPGCPALNIRPEGKNIEIRNGILKSNARDSGYGLTGEDMLFLLQIDQSQHVKVENMRCIDGWRSIGGSLASDVQVYHCNTTVHNKLWMYVQWEYQVDRCQRWRFEDCIVDNDHIRPGFEPFKSSEISFTRCGGRNTAFATNAAGNCFFKDCFNVWDAEIEPGWHINSSIFTANRGIEDSQGHLQEGTEGPIYIDGFRMEYKSLPKPNTLQQFLTINGSKFAKAIIRIRDVTYNNKFPDSIDSRFNNKLGYVVTDGAGNTDVRFGGNNRIDVLNNGVIYSRNGQPRTPNEDVRMPEDSRIDDVKNMLDDIQRDDAAEDAAYETQIAKLQAEKTEIVTKTIAELVLARDALNERIAKLETEIG